MESINIFTQDSYFAITLFTLGLLLFSTIFSSRADKIAAPLWLLFGLAVEFVAGGVSAEVTNVYNEGGSITAYVFVELLLLLIAMIFMAMAASQLLIRSLPSSPVIVMVTVLGVVAIAFFLFISPDGEMVNSMRQIFPLAAFAYIALSFWAQTFQRFNGGNLISALATTIVTVFLSMRLSGIQAVVAADMWFIPALTYTLLSLAFIMLYSDSMQTKLQKTELEVEKYNNRIEEIIRSSPFPIIISRLSDDKIILANNNAVKLFGINPRELERYRLKDFFADSDNRQLLNERLEQEREVQDFEILVKTPISNTPFWLLASANVIDYNYDVVLYSAYQDITSRKNRETLLKNQATRDPLTSLYNRRYFEDEVSKLILKAKADKTPYSDTYGHKVGDKVLIELASTSERALRDKDIVARYGGEEFVVFLPGIDSKEGRGVADRLRESISQVVVYSDDNKPVTFTVSIGVSSSEISDNIDTLIKTADEALYRAKQNGRNRVEVFSPKDFDDFVKQGQVERKDESQNHHPVFDKENVAEISLLDGIETSKLQNEQTFVEDARESRSVLPGVDAEDLK